MSEERFILSGIKFGVLPPYEISRMARVTVTRPELYESDGTPVMGGPRDPHFGAIEPGEACPVCGNRRDNCPGHFGKIDLARPVLIPYYSDHVNAVLQATCRSCSRILLPDEQVKRMLRVLRTLKARWPQLASNFIREIRKQAAQNSVCPHCGARQYRIRYIRPVVFYEERPEGEVRLTPIEIRDRLEKVRNEDAELLGLDPEASRPEWMVATVLPVPPLAVRPPITLETGLKSEDDLTHALVEIIRQNERLKHYLATSAPETMVEDSWIALQHMIAAYIDNELPNVFVLQHRGGRPLKTLAQRLKGKEGRLRG
ncbi:MAG: DNA-directed RNA polymerase subunit A', partial [Desulfurococcales archaeon]|nr:DNA-directed RNA polymerase subunit A' [Desulfurococcales archaeon]